MRKTASPFRIVSLLSLCLLLAGCAGLGAAPASSSAPDPSAARAEVQQVQAGQGAGDQPFTCPVSVPELVTPPDDSAVLNEPAPGYYYLNADQSIWASSWDWGLEKEYHWRAGEQGNKVGWFRPAGAELQITGRRLDGESAPLEAHVPCCYPTRFQATGLTFPTAGCWEVTAKAAESELVFVVEVE